MRKSGQLFLIIGVMLVAMMAGCKKSNPIDDIEDNDPIIGKWKTVNVEHETYDKNGILLEKHSGIGSWKGFWQEFRPNGVMYESQDKDPLKWSRNGDILYRIFGDEPNDRHEYKIIKLTGTELVTRLRNETYGTIKVGDEYIEAAYIDQTEYFEKIP